MALPRGGDVYGGVCGQTRTELIHYSCPCGVMFTAHAHRAVNGTRDPALGARLRDGTLLNVACPACGKQSTVGLALAYHDEENRLLVLVLPEALRHRELEERAELLLQIARDRGHPVPRYVSEFQTVFGGAGLLALLEHRAAHEVQAGVLADRARELDAKNETLAGREAEVEVRAAELDRVAADMDHRAAELIGRADDLALRGEELARRFAELESAAALEAAAQVPPHDDGTTGPYTKLDEVEALSQDPPTPTPALAAALPAAHARSHDSNSTRVAPPPGRDVAVERWVVSRQPTMTLVEQGQVRLLATLPGDRLEAFLAGGLSPRLLLHRVPAYPIVVLAVAHEQDDVEPVPFFFDLQRVDDRSTLGALTHGFRVTLDLYDVEYLPVVQHELHAPLEENTALVVSAAERHFASIPVGQRSFDQALSQWRAPGFDRYGRRAHNLEEDSFALLPTAATTRLALNIVAYWSEPENEDYLIYARSFPVEWWRKIQARVLARAVEFGIALPSALAQLALKQGLARTRKELAHRLVHAFGDVAAGLKPNDLDPQEIQENWRTLVSECEALGVALEGKAGDLAAIAVGAMPGGPPPTRSSRGSSGPGMNGSPLGGNGSGNGNANAIAIGASSSSGANGERPKPRLRVGTPVIAGEIASSSGEDPPRRDLRQADAKELIGLLEDKDLRRDAALELCRRGEPTAVGPVFGALRRMTRGEAVRVLPGVVAFGERATPHLVDGLRSRKGFVRHGCALALGVLKAADGIEPLCDLLLAEPTDVWREVARALGEVGAGAVMSLAARLRDQPPDKRERIAWALAHVAARGGRAPVETLSQGRDPVASAAAQKALELAADARINDTEVRGNGTPRDQTVNRAFSRRFFEAMNGRGTMRSLDSEARTGGGHTEEVQLEDAEILDEDEELLDDEDLLPG